MSFAAALDSMNSACVTTLGVSVVVRVGATDTVLTAIFDRPAENIGGNLLNVHDINPSAEFITSSFAATGAAKNDYILIDGVEHLIVQVDRDDGGITRVELRAA